MYKILLIHFKKVKKKVIFIYNDKKYYKIKEIFKLKNIIIFEKIFIEIIIISKMKT